MNKVQQARLHANATNTTKSIEQINCKQNYKTFWGPEDTQSTQ